MSKHDMIRIRLSERLGELQNRLDGIEQALDETPSADAEDRATEREGDEALESLGLAGLDEIRAIEAALKRIDDGTYGVCVNCGEDILPERLVTVPFTARCRFCAREV